MCKKQKGITTHEPTTLLDVLKTHPNGVRVYDSQYGADCAVWRLPTESMDAQKALVWMLAERITASNVMVGDSTRCLANINGFVQDNLGFIQELSSYSQRMQGSTKDPVFLGIETIQDFTNPDGDYPQLDALRFVSYLDPLIGPSLKIDARWY